MCLGSGRWSSSLIESVCLSSHVCLLQCVHASPLILADLPPFYRPRWGSAIGSFPWKELLCRGTMGHLTLVKSCLSIHALVVWASQVALMASDVGSEKSQCHHCRLCAASTPGRHSLGLGVAHHVAGAIGDNVLRPRLDRSLVVHRLRGP